MKRNDVVAHDVVLRSNRIIYKFSARILLYFFFHCKKVPIVLCVFSYEIMAIVQDYI